MERVTELAINQWGLRLGTPIARLAVVLLLRLRELIMKLILLFALVMTLPAAFGRGSSSGVSVPTIKYFSQVSEGIYRGARPASVAELQQLKDFGIKTVINLQGGGWFKTDASGESWNGRMKERETVLWLGMNYFNVPFTIFRPMLGNEEQEYYELAAAMNSPKNQPVYVHCKLGFDRTGTVIALYRILYQNCSLDQVRVELKENGVAWTSVMTIFQKNMLVRAENNPYRNRKVSCPLRY